MPGQPLAIKFQSVVRLIVCHVEHVDCPLAFRCRMAQADFGNLDFPAGFTAKPHRPTRIESTAKSANNLDALV